MTGAFRQRIPWIDYLGLFTAYIGVYAELIFRVFIYLIPDRIREWGRRRVIRIYHYYITTKTTDGMTDTIQKCRNIYEICEAFGYKAEEHLLRTEDNFILCLHRITHPSKKRTKKRGVVYCHHGLMTNSDLWVAVNEPERNLPFVLVDNGYDVWLGNNRGNKYSRKHVIYKPKDEEFWNFSLDDMAMFDIPNTVDYILHETGEEKLSYIGFSQGTAQAFASLSLNNSLNNKVNIFIALAPAFTPRGFSNHLVDYLVKANPKIMYNLFGRRSLFPSVTFWQNICYPPIFVKVVDFSLKLLFDWDLKNISANQKLCGYAHLYSFSSVKSCVHWLQIIKNCTFQLYDDDLAVITGYTARHYQVPLFPTSNIKCPILLLWGGKDTLINMEYMRTALPPQAQEIEIEHYEHLDFLWADDVKEQVIPKVLEALPN
ncbi:triglyceride lipase-cholesterol esterase [Schizosaccharomyces osmophilus]|uniref:Lipase n=1 Tax=Schizosaccharomyces osmophilus TaxID=2545709 RepID=A0AAE9WEX1_9SCHI|nr:triglyceride lipase-cholesterol esterase [Schizosaccharomyces osmophilus]WBW74394.1 triglyceride lipase-cholesterol esterase [Schizosaccharomyces osmophilus]